MFIFTRTLVTYARTIFKPRCCLNFQSIRTQAESTYIAHNMFGQIKMEIPWYIKGVRVTQLYPPARAVERGTLIGIRSCLEKGVADQEW